LVDDEVEVGVEVGVDGAVELADKVAVLVVMVVVAAPIDVDGTAGTYVSVIVQETIAPASAPFLSLQSPLALYPAV